MVHFLAWDGIAQSLFSKFTAYQRESTCLGLIGRKLYWGNMIMPKYAEKICDMRTLIKYAKHVAKCQICGNHIFAFF